MVPAEFEGHRRLLPLRPQLQPDLKVVVVNPDQRQQALVGQAEREQRAPELLPLDRVGE